MFITFFNLLFFLKLEHFTPETLCLSFITRSYKHLKVFYEVKTIGKTSARPTAGNFLRNLLALQGVKWGGLKKWPM